MQSVLHRPLTLAVLFLPVLVAGCNHNNKLIVENHELIRAPEGSVSVYQLAGLLEMRVVDSSVVCATLTDGQATVVVFADPGGEVHVNGKPVGPTGGIVSVGDMLFVPTAAVEPLKSAVRAAQPRANTRPLRRSPKRKPRVVLDAGHGGHKPGAIGCNGVPEKMVNLPVTLAAGRILRGRGVSVILTRSDDKHVELNERAAIAIRERADLFVSIHADASEDRSARGFTAYVSRSAAKESLRLARAILNEMAARTSPSRGIRRADFRVLVRTTCPAVLIELGYLSNDYEARRLTDAAYQQQLAEAIADGVMNFLR
ncbi:MAG: N-acetylmuramoyl-L-alanine amidase family protein [Planctomycetota bacterium]|jgi:N-acetylmuramoyl-L-alanine amidase